MIVITGLGDGDSAAKMFHDDDDVFLFLGLEWGNELLHFP